MSCVTRAACALAVAISTACTGPGGGPVPAEDHAVEHTAEAPPPESASLPAEDARASAAAAIAAWERWEEAFSLASPAAISVRYAEDAVLMLGAEAVVGASRIGRYYELVLASIPDLEREVLGGYAREGEVAVVAHIRGTHAGELMGAPATGARIGQTQLSRLVVDPRGLITRHEVYADALNLTAQLGLRNLHHRDADDVPFVAVDREGAEAEHGGDPGRALEALLDAWSAGDADRAAALFTEDALLFDAAAAANVVGPRAIAAHARELGAAFASLRRHELEVWTRGSHAIATFRLHGVHTGTWARLGLRGSGESFELPAALVVAIRDDAHGERIERALLFYDGLALARTLEAGR
jgi:ketosteroid isomerase-like protein